MIKRLKQLLFKTERPESIDSCQCNVCVDMCRVPCWPTPHQAIMLMRAGHTGKLEINDYAVEIKGVSVDVAAVVPKKNTKTRACIFLRGDKCQLHGTGMKPIEGRLAHHSQTNAYGREIKKEIAMMWYRDDLAMKYYLRRKACNVAD